MKNWLARATGENDPPKEYLPRLRALALEIHLSKNLLYSWTEYLAPHTTDIFKRFQVRYIVYIGEADGGCTANDEFHEILDRRFELTVLIPPQTFRASTTTFKFNATRPSRLPSYVHFQRLAAGAAASWRCRIVTAPSKNPSGKKLRNPQRKRGEKTGMPNAAELQQEIP